jgi:hypothetical protein
VMDGVKNPRFVRAVFGNLPVGEYSIVVANRVGAVKWIDLVRARKGEVQFLSFQEAL